MVTVVSSSANVSLNSSVFWVITRRKVFQSDVSKIPVVPISKGHGQLEA
jgi:hypothetical protein